MIEIKETTPGALRQRICDGVFDVYTMLEGETMTVRVLGTGEYETKNGRIIDYIDFRKEEEEEIFRIWLGGNLKYGIMRWCKQASPIDRIFQITRKGKVDFELEDGTMAKCSDYKVVEMQY